MRCFHVPPKRVCLMLLVSGQSENERRPPCKLPGAAGAAAAASAWRVGLDWLPLQYNTRPGCQDVRYPHHPYPKMREIQRNWEKSIVPVARNTAVQHHSLWGSKETRPAAAIKMCKLFHPNVTVVSLTLKQVLNAFWNMIKLKSRATINCTANWLLIFPQNRFLCYHIFFY